MCDCKQVKLFLQGPFTPERGVGKACFLRCIWVCCPCYMCRCQIIFHGTTNASCENRVHGTAVLCGWVQHNLKKYCKHYFFVCSGKFGSPLKWIGYQNRTACFSMNRPFVLIKHNIISVEWCDFSNCYLLSLQVLSTFAGSLYLTLPLWMLQMKRVRTANRSYSHCYFLITFERVCPGPP